MESGTWNVLILVIHAKVKDNTALYMLNINCVGYYRKSIEEKEGQSERKGVRGGRGVD